MNIEKLAREAGGTVMHPYDYGAKPDRMILTFDSLQRLAALIRAEVLEEAAKVCDMEADDYRQNQCGASDGRYDWKEDSAKDCATAIRALKDK